MWVEVMPVLKVVFTLHSNLRTSGRRCISDRFDAT